MPQLYRFSFTEGAGITVNSVNSVRSKPDVPIEDGEFLIPGDELDITSDVYVSEAFLGSFEGFVLAESIREAFERVKELFEGDECPPVEGCSKCPFIVGCLVQEDYCVYDLL